MKRLPDRQEVEREIRKDIEETIEIQLEKDFIVTRIRSLSNAINAILTKDIQFNDENNAYVVQLREWARELHNRLTWLDEQTTDEDWEENNE